MNTPPPLPRGQVVPCATTQVRHPWQPTTTHGPNHECIRYKTDMGSYIRPHHGLCMCECTYTWTTNGGGAYLDHPPTITPDVVEVSGIPTTPCALCDTHKPLNELRMVDITGTTNDHTEWWCKDTKACHAIAFPPDHSHGAPPTHHQGGGEGSTRKNDDPETPIPVSISLSGTDSAQGVTGGFNETGSDPGFDPDPRWTAAKANFRAGHAADCQCVTSPERPCDCSMSCTMAEDAAQMCNHGRPLDECWPADGSDPVSASGTGTPVDENGMAALRARVAELDSSLNVAHADIDRLQAAQDNLTEHQLATAADLDTWSAELDRVSENLTTRMDALVKADVGLSRRVQDVEQAVARSEGTAPPQPNTDWIIPPGLFMSPYDPVRTRALLRAAEAFHGAATDFLYRGHTDSRMRDAAQVLGNALSAMDPEK